MPGPSSIEFVLLLFELSLAKKDKLLQFVPAHFVNTIRYYFLVVLISYRWIDYLIGQHRYLI